MTHKGDASFLNTPIEYYHALASIYGTIGDKGLGARSRNDLVSIDIKDKEIAEVKMSESVNLTDYYSPVQTVAKEENFVQVNVGYEPGQGSQVGDEIYVSGSQPPDVDAIQAEKESDYVPHNVSGHDTVKSIQSIVLAGSGVADGDEEGEEMHTVMEEEGEYGFAEDLDSENS
ncbi:putative nuclease HARBI1 [Hordeum vulgare]|nr:putative nuclease HARBI1 [Hordeum vulgare]